LTFVTRFAPSPTGPLHLGHAYSALLAHDMAGASGGRFLLRIEDIDRSRARPEWEVQIYDDLKWLDLEWETPVMRQSDRLAAYANAIKNLWHQGLLYPCNCNRRDITAATAAPQEGDRLYGPDGIIYPGTCRSNHTRVAPFPNDQVLRLDMSKALDSIGDDTPMTFRETGAGAHDETGENHCNREKIISGIGDIVIARRDIGTSYHLSVVLDDAAQGITHVIRGEDLFEATKIHVVLQKLLNLPTPIYHHHRLIRDEHGKRLAKRDDARALRKYHAEGVKLDDIRHLVGL
jgi:glutamyl-Q tRNA(Asp) synthetase